MSVPLLGSRRFIPIGQFVSISITATWMCFYSIRESGLGVCRSRAHLYSDRTLCISNIMAFEERLSDFLIPREKCGEAFFIVAPNAISPIWPCVPAYIWRPAIRENSSSSAASGLSGGASSLTCDAVSAPLSCSGDGFV